MSVELYKINKITHNGEFGERYRERRDKDHKELIGKIIDVNSSYAVCGVPLVLKYPDGNEVERSVVVDIYDNKDNIIIETYGSIYTLVKTE